MANMCDNHLEFTCKELPSWFKKNPDADAQWDGIQLDIDPHYLFLYNDFESIVNPTSNDSYSFIKNNNKNILEHTFQFWFETKWSPPEDLYTSMLTDDNIISFNALWYEPGCGCLGYANKDEGIQYEDAPDRNYSDFLDLDILKAEPPQCYINIEGSDSWATFEKYKELMQEKLAQSSTEDKVIIVDEVKEMTEYFSDEQSE